MGQEENSAFTYLEVYGEDGADVPPEIIVAPKDTEIVKGTQVTELQVIRLSHLSLETISVWVSMLFHYLWIFVLSHFDNACLVTLTCNFCEKKARLHHITSFTLVKRSHGT